MFKNLVHILYHLVVVVLSAAAALSLPFAVRFVAQKYLVYWSFIEHEQIFLVAVEIAVAVFLIISFNYMKRSWKDRKASGMAMAAGLFLVVRPKGLFTPKRVRKFKERQGFARDVMIIGSTGSRTFADPAGDLHQVIRNCREAKIMLLNPFSEGAHTRARSIDDPAITPEGFRDQILESIDFLKGLKAAQKNVRLKLYQDKPLLKIAIFGDYLSVMHYHAGLDVRNMPEYVFTHQQNPGGLYLPFYQYFLSRWQDPDIPEYELDTDDLVYRDRTGNEIRREPFARAESGGDLMNVG
ncbi:MAG TPA: hypothetical protein VEI96_00355 [Thermodesulfovibrionales bacterium]|nr:hypothetical protein [Thermodesulfovibrionales bacterium]